MSELQNSNQRLLYRLAGTALMGTLEAKTGLPRKHLAVITLLCSILLWMIVFGLQVFCDIAAFVYPAYKTFKILQKSPPSSPLEYGEGEPGSPLSPDSDSPYKKEIEGEGEMERKERKETFLKEQYILWLSYWLVYGFLDIVEVPADFLFKRFPSYFLLKVIFMLWVFLEFHQTRGCVYVYQYVVGPLFRYFHDHIELGIEKSLFGVKQVIGESTDVAANLFSNAITNVISPQTVAETASHLIIAASKVKASQTQTQTQTPVENQSGKKLQ